MLVTEFVVGAGGREKELSGTKQRIVVLLLINCIGVEFVMGFGGVDE